MTDWKCCDMLRLATTTRELDAIYRFRYFVYVEEMRKNPTYADHDARMLRDTIEEESENLYVEQEGRIIATVRSTRLTASLRRSPLGKTFALERFDAFGDSDLVLTSRLMVHPDHRRTGLVGNVLAELYQRTRVSGARFGFLQCRTSLVSMYERIGFRRYCANVLDPDLGYEVPMVIVMGDRAHLERVHSPVRALGPASLEVPPETGWLEEQFPGARELNSRLMRTQDAFWSILAGSIAEQRAAFPKLFQGLGDEELGLVMRDSVVLRCEAGDQIIRKGDPGFEMFVILSGRAVVTMAGPGGTVEVHDLVPGEVFGELAYLTECPRSADVVARTELTVLVLPQAALRQLMVRSTGASSKLLFNLSVILCDRLRVGVVGLA